jgi:hypothetical protein
MVDDAELLAHLRSGQPPTEWQIFRASQLPVLLISSAIAVPILAWLGYEEYTGMVGVLQQSGPSPFPFAQGLATSFTLVGVVYPLVVAGFLLTFLARLLWRRHQVLVVLPDGAVIADPARGRVLSRVRFAELSDLRLGSRYEGDSSFRTLVLIVVPRSGRPYVWRQLSGYRFLPDRQKLMQVMVGAFAGYTAREAAAVQARDRKLLEQSRDSTAAPRASTEPPALIWATPATPPHLEAREVLWRVQQHTAPDGWEVRWGQTQARNLTAVIFVLFSLAVVACVALPVLFASPGISGGDYVNSVFSILSNPVFLIFIAFGLFGAFMALRSARSARRQVLVLLQDGFVVGEPQTGQVDFQAWYGEVALITARPGDDSYTVLVTYPDGRVERWKLDPRFGFHDEVVSRLIADLGRYRAVG